MLSQQIQHKKYYYPSISFHSTVYVFPNFPFLLVLPVPTPVGEVISVLFPECRSLFPLNIISFIVLSVCIPRMTENVQVWAFSFWFISFNITPYICPWYSKMQNLYFLISFLKILLHCVYWLYPMYYLSVPDWLFLTLVTQLIILSLNHHL